MGSAPTIRLQYTGMAARGRTLSLYEVAEVATLDRAILASLPYNPGPNGAGSRGGLGQRRPAG